MEKYQLAEKDYIAGMKYKDIADKYEVSINTVKSWKNRYWNKEKGCTQKAKKVAHKKVKEVAKALIEEGYTISEVANQTELHPSSLKRMSTEGNLQQSQLEYLKAFREKNRERIRLNKEKRLQVNETALDAIEYEIDHWEGNGGISKAAMEKLIMNEEAEQKILELDRIERFEKLEFEKEKAKDTDDKEDKVISGLEALKGVIDARRKV